MHLSRLTSLGARQQQVLASSLPSLPGYSRPWPPPFSDTHASFQRHCLHISPPSIVAVCTCILIFPQLFMYRRPPNKQELLFLGATFATTRARIFRLPAFKSSPGSRSSWRLLSYAHLITYNALSIWKMCLSENFQTFLSFLANTTYLCCATLRNVPRLLEFWCFWHLSLLSVPTSAALSLLVTWGSIGTRKEEERSMIHSLSCLASPHPTSTTSSYLLPDPTSSHPPRWCRWEDQHEI